MFKKLSVLVIAMFILSTSIYANDEVMAEINVGSNADHVVSLVDLFAKEAVKENSKLNLYLKDLREKEFLCQIEDTITANDISYIESFSTNGNFSMHYLIFIRCEHRSSTYNVGYLSAYAFGMEANIDTIQIDKPVQVTIE
jgi:hypothetical protein